MVKHERLFAAEMSPWLRENRRNQTVRRLDEALQTCDQKDAYNLIRGVLYFIACNHDDADRMEYAADNIETAAEVLVQQLRDGAEHMRCRRAAAERNALD